MIETKFKQTEIGWIPEEWEVELLGNLSSDCSYGVSAEAISYDGHHKYIRITDIDDTNGCYCSDSPVSPMFFTRKHIVKINDLLIARTGASVGKTYLYNKKDGLLVYAGFLMKLNISEANSQFIFYQTKSNTYLSWIISESNRTGQPGINLQQIKKYPLPLPPLPEQHRIATALSDVDALIVSLDKLIAKKQAIKQGAMQQLLTGKKRLKGFDEPWRSANIGSDTTVKARIGWQGLTTDEYLANGNYYLVGGIDFLNGKVDWSNCNYVSEWRFAQDSNIQLKIGDVLISKDGTIGKVAYVSSLPLPATLNSGVFVLRSKKDFLMQEYLALVFLSPIFKRFMDELVAGSTIQHLYQKDIVKFTFPIPETTEEQCAIATILTDMDNEITSLQAKKAKYEQVKQGMMQQLLTGKIRLVDNHQAEVKGYAVMDEPAYYACVAEQSIGLP